MVWGKDSRYFSFWVKGLFFIGGLVWKEGNVGGIGEDCWEKGGGCEWREKIKF